MTATGTVVAAYVDATLAGRQVTATLTPATWRPVDEGLVLPRPVTVPVSTAGTGQLVVAASTPDWYYVLTEVVDGVVVRSIPIAVPAGATVQLKSVVAMVPPSVLIVPVRMVAGISPTPAGDIALAALQQALGTGDGAVPTSRQVIAGPGLTGGGPLTGDIAMAVIYGTAVNTAAAGNDPRIVGAVQAGLVEAKGDLYVGSAADTVVRVPVGDPGHVLTSVPGAPAGVGWSAPSAAIPGLAEGYGMLGVACPPGSATNVGRIGTGRLTAHWLPVPAGRTITGVALALDAVGSGPGSAWCGVYQADLTQLGTTADLAAALAGGTTPQWRQLPLTAPGIVTGSGVWVCYLSTVDATTSAQLRFAATPPSWLFNPGWCRRALHIEGQAALPATLSLGAAIDYVDMAIGVY